jgi:NADH dehydrogenase
MKAKSHLLILGGGFGGLYAALQLEKELSHRDDFEVTLISQDNFFLFTPMLHEVASAEQDPTNIVSPLRKFFKRVKFYACEVEKIDLEKQEVIVSHGYDYHQHRMTFDHLVLGLGSITNFFSLPGLQENSVTMKSLSDAIGLRNRIIAHLEEANSECSRRDQAPLLTFVVAGGGFAGVETIGSLNDLVRSILPYYPRIEPKTVRFILVHPGEAILPELGPDLGHYAAAVLRERGVEIFLKTRVQSATPHEVTLNSGAVITCNTLVWTAGTSPSPLLESIPVEKEKGKIKVGADLRSTSHPHVWALGDCAWIPDEKGIPYPPTAQHSSRQGPVLAKNLLRALDQKPLLPFRFKTLGLLASIGHQTGVAQIMGVQFSGIIAWIMWRTIYWAKLPGWDKRIQVGFAWLLDFFFTKDFVEFSVGTGTKVKPPENPSLLRTDCEMGLS